MTNTVTPARHATSAVKRRAGQGRHGGRWSRAVLGLVVLWTAGCSLDGLLDSERIPADVTDPSITQTAEGARAAYNGTVAAFANAFGGVRFAGDVVSVVHAGGTLSDELRIQIGQEAELDRRELPEGSTAGHSTYQALQKVRNQAGQAIGLLTRYLPDQPALAGRLYALQGYTEIFLAELFCSGIPLSTLDYDGDFTYRPGSSTAEVFRHAVALFDTALALAADSARFADLARVGRARALLALGEDTSYAAAAAAVAPVVDGYRFDVSYHAATPETHNFAGAYNGTGDVAVRHWSLTVPDREGANGLDWRSSGDPRTDVRVDSATVNDVYQYTYHPMKYAVDGSSPLVLASGVEARLIEAEAALQAGDAGTWLAKLNQLRQMAPSVNPAWPVLPDTTDPGTPDGRVDLLFRERAFWLFLTGHRQGDLRRLIRQYGRTQDQVYPVGFYGTNSFGLALVYGTDVTMPTPEQHNPLFTGCASRGA